MNQLLTFGDQAAVFTSRLPADVSVLVCEPATAIDALAETVRRRQAGEPVFVRVLLEDTTAHIAKKVALALLTQASDYDAARHLFDNLAAGRLVIGENPQSSIVSYSATAIQTLRDLGLFASGFVVASWTEYERLRKLLGYDPQHVVCFAQSDAVHLPQRTAANSIVIWGPQLGPDELLLPAFALEELHAPLFVVAARSAQYPFVRAKFITPEEAQDALAAACVILDYSTMDPSAALALARSGAGLAVSSTSGAHEYLHNAAVFDPGNRISIRSAVQTAMARPPVTLRKPLPDPAVLREAIDATAPKEVAGGPLVTLIIATYNRRNLLPLALETAERQTYRNLEILVVNDGGDAVEDVVAQFPRARLVNNPENLKAMETFNNGVRHAKGEYVQFMADDDFLFPECVAVLVQAVTRGDYQLANANCMQAFQQRDESGEYKTFGYGVFGTETMDRSEFLIHSAVAFGSTIWRREAYIELGFMQLSDRDFVMCAAERFDFPHVDHVVYLVSKRTDASNQMAYERDLVVERVSRYYAKHPAPGRPYIEARREAVLADFARIQGGYDILSKPAEVLREQDRS